jgi:hypothetical protein
MEHTVELFSRTGFSSLRQWRRTVLCNEVKYGQFREGSKGIMESTVVPDEAWQDGLPWMRRLQHCRCVCHVASEWTDPLLLISRPPMRWLVTHNEQNATQPPVLLKKHFRSFCAWYILKWYRHLSDEFIMPAVRFVLVLGSLLLL